MLVITFGSAIFNITQIIYRVQGYAGTGVCGGDTIRAGETATMGSICTHEVKNITSGFDHMGQNITKSVVIKCSSDIITWVE